MIQSFLDSLEDPNRPLFGPNYWLLQKMGLLLSDNVYKIVFYIIHVIANLFVFSQYVELYIIRSDLDLVMRHLTLSMLSSVIVIKANSFMIWQDNWHQLINYITEADKFERDNHDEAKGKIITTYTKYCRRVTYFYWAFVYVTAFSLIANPLMLRYAASSKFREEVKNGTEPFPHVFSAWVPYDKQHSPGCWATFSFHIVIVIYGSTIISAYDTSVIVVLMCFGGKLDLLRIRCREMLGTLGKGISNENADTAIRQMHHIHVLLLKHSRLLNSILSPLMFFYVAMCTFMICASTFQLTSATNSTTLIFTANYLLFGIIQLFMFCWHSDDVIHKSHNVILGPFESEWWAANLQQRKAVLLLQGQLRIGHMYTAGPFTDLTLSTFITILKGAYSYYTLLSK